MPEFTDSICPNQTLISNINNKETNVMPEITTIIPVIESDICVGLKCTHPAKHQTIVFWKGQSAFFTLRPELENLVADGGNDWTRVGLPLCGNHNNWVKKSIRVKYDIVSAGYDKALSLIEDAAYDAEHAAPANLDNYNCTRLDWMGTVAVEKCDHESCWEDAFEMLAELRVENCCGVQRCDHYRIINCDKKKETIKMIKCGKCKGEHPTVEDVAACYGVQNKRTAFVPKATGITCGNCRKMGVANPVHDTTAQVKACYANKS